VRFDDARSVAESLEPSYPVYCLRPNVLKETARHFLSTFPGTVLYAIKCNPNPLVLDALYAAGVRHFDTASLPEIAQVTEAYPEAKSYFMHPVKSRAVIKSAYQVYGVRHFVVDHSSEFEKVMEETGGEGITIVVRLTTPPAENTLYHLASKFGAAPAEAVKLLKAADAQGCKTGLAFHVGSQCLSPEAYRIALRIVGDVMETAGVALSCVDVGGGFPGPYLNMDVPPLEAFMEAIRGGLKEISLCPTVEVFSEPGRALVAAGCSLLTQVQLRKGDQLYINDGMYGSLSELAAGGIELPARLIRLKGKASAKMEAFTLSGPTCDSLDVIPGTFDLPHDAREGDWIEIDRVGAYSNANATRFNGFFPETFVEVFDEPPLARAPVKKLPRRRAGKPPTASNGAARVPGPVAPG
jgi:ornithine decarboxylase